MRRNLRRRARKNEEEANLQLAELNRQYDEVQEVPESEWLEFLEVLNKSEGQVMESPNEVLVKGGDDNPLIEIFYEIIDDEVYEIIDDERGKKNDDDDGVVQTSYASNEETRREERNPVPMSQEEMLQEERRADIEWEAMCNCIPGRYEWKQAKLKREADEERHRAHKEFIDKSEEMMQQTQRTLTSSCNMRTSTMRNKKNRIKSA